jgi:hypothetical protein
MDKRGSRGWAVDQRLVVVAHADYQHSTGSQFRPHRPERLREVLIGEEVRDRIIARDHNVECTLHRTEITEVADGEGDFDAQACCLDACAAQRAFADVRSLNSIAKTGQADCLRPNPARTIKHIDWVPMDCAYQPVKSGTLSFDCGVPIFIH